MLKERDLVCNTILISPTTEKCDGTFWVTSLSQWGAKQRKQNLLVIHNFHQYAQFSKGNNNSYNWTVLWNDVPMAKAICFFHQVICSSYTYFSDRKKYLCRHEIRVTISCRLWVVSNLPSVKKHRKAGKSGIMAERRACTRVLLGRGHLQAVDSLCLDGLCTIEDVPRPCLAQFTWRMVLEQQGTHQYYFDRYFGRCPISIL